MTESPDTPAAVTQNAVVVESGPVAYEDPGDEEEEEEEEQCVSAMQLIGGDGQSVLSCSAHVLFIAHMTRSDIKPAASEFTD